MASPLRQRLRDMDAVRSAYVWGATLGRPTPSTPGVHILMYHGMRSADRLAFERQLRRLRATADLLPLSDAIDALAGGWQGGRAFALTFDDGRQDAFDHALPILAAHEVPATFFLVPGWIDGARPGTLDWDAARTLSAAGMEIGSHSLSHARLATLTGAEVQHELTLSRARIEAELGRQCHHFACPWGQPDEDYQPTRDPALARAAGYHSFLTTTAGQAHPGTDPYHLPRVRMEPHWGQSELRYATRR